MNLAILVSLGIILYSFIGYPFLIWIWIQLRNSLQKASTPQPSPILPSITLVVPCYNEAPLLEKKIANCRELDYPKDSLNLLFITDGSTDNSQEIVKRHPDITCLHQPLRKGKTAAENRAMESVTTELVIFSDANTLLNAAALQNIVRHFSDSRIACVAGEKRIQQHQKDNASGSGEQLYWQYESWVKQLDARLYSCVGAAGELVAFRTSLYQALPPDCLLDDFMQSMQMAARGYRIAYEAGAFATEPASPTLEEELKRKTRIAAGAWQSMQRLRPLINPIRTPVLFFQYFSRRILRWAFVPYLLIAVAILSVCETLLDKGNFFVRWLVLAQCLFYIVAVLGYLFRNRSTHRKWLFAPCYFCIMHYAMIAGAYRYLKGEQSAIWEKADRKR
ncbi:MAG: glycosyltransferase family 2 protein [Bacteroidota bacterium]|nr:glycosyltransferase family 2 protein [Bacteroidota bacterium]